MEREKVAKEKLLISSSSESGASLSLSSNSKSHSASNSNSLNSSSHTPLPHLNLGAGSPGLCLCSSPGYDSGSGRYARLSAAGALPLDEFGTYRMLPHPAHFHEIAGTSWQFTF